MSVKMYPKRECRDCKHVVDIEEDITGRDLITCELDECEHCSCIEEETSAFKPCPMCGHGLTMENVSFIDEEGYPFEELDWLWDFLNGKESDPAGLTQKEKDEIFEVAASKMGAVMVSCSCGFYFWEDAESMDFPDEGWFDRFCEKANRRWKE